MKFDVIIPSAGKGIRFGGKKQYLNLMGKPVLVWSAEKFLSLPYVNAIYIGVSREDYSLALDIISRYLEPDKQVVIYFGGEERKDTVYNGLVLSECDCVMIHDAVRPFFSKNLVERLINSFHDCDGVIPVIPVSDTVKEVEDGLVRSTLKRDRIYRVQTPQLFKRDVLLEGYGRIDPDFCYTDDASIAETVGAKIRVVEGEPLNIKITNREDLLMVEGMMAEVRVGFGYDIHRLAEGNGIVLGGVYIPCGYSLVGHSDGDAVIHAICDALCGAVSMGDIGKWFPPEDERFRGMDSGVFLAEIWGRIRDDWELLNVDITIILERPKLGNLKETIRDSLAKRLGLSGDRISVKAKTKEGLDSVGESKAVEVYALVSLRRRVVKEEA